MGTLTDAAAPAPIGAGERIEAMDVLRGFALLGILLMNIEAFVHPLYQALGGINSNLTGADHAVDAVNEWLVRGKFVTLFSLLFGMGFAVMLQRADARGGSGAWIYLRRLLALLVIGLAHAVLIWSGDILVSYALAGLLLLLLFRRTPVSRLPKWGLALYCVPLLLTWALALSSIAAQSDPAAAAQMQEEMAKSQAMFAEGIDAQRQAYGNGSYAQATARRIVDTKDQLGFFAFVGPMYLGLFVLGAWFIRSGAMRDPESHLRLYKRLRGWGLLLGLPAVALGLWLSPGMTSGAAGPRAAIGTTWLFVGNLLLCLGYMATIVLALRKPRWRERLAWLAPAGRMALTNYLMQSVICTLVFYRYGLDYFDRLPRAWQPVFVLALFALQVAFSRWWLARYRFGPMEWLWRWATYGKRPPMRVAATA